MTRRSPARPLAGALALLAGLALVTGGPRAFAQAKKSDSVVKVSATAPKPADDGKQVVTVTLDVKEGWYIYANPVGLADFEDNQTVVKVEAKKPAKVKVSYPEGKEVKDKVVGSYKTYEGKVTIKATVQRAKGDSGPLDVKVKFQACSDVTKTCLPPATVKLSVE